MGNERVDRRASPHPSPYQNLTRQLSTMQPNKRHPTRGEQLLGGQLGTHFTSPKKRRKSAKKQLLVDSFAAKAKIAKLQEKQRAIEERLKAMRSQAESSASVAGPSSTAAGVEPDPLVDFEPACDQDLDIPEPETDPATSEPSDTLREVDPSPPKPKRLVPHDKDERLYERWAELVPALITPYLRYSQATSGKDWCGIPDTLVYPQCQAPETCSVAKHKLTAVLFASTSRLP